MKKNLVWNPDRSSKGSKLHACVNDAESSRSVAWDSEAETVSGGLIPPLPQEVCSILWHSILVAPIANTARLPLLV